MKYYRIITIDVLNRVPIEGIDGDRSNQRVSVDGTKAIVERAEGFNANERWFTHEEALEIVAGPEWNSNELP